MARAGRKWRVAAWLWALAAAVASFELIADAWIRTQVPADQSWQEAAAFVRARIGSNDRLVAAPSWAEPILRLHLGDLMTLRSAAPEDSARFDRMWELGIRGQSTRKDPPDLEERFGGVRVRMWELVADDVPHDFVDRIADAQVELVRGDASRPCRWVDAPGGRGGLGQGPMVPDERFVCDPSRPWLWVGSTILADLTLTPKRCIWQHPAGPEPVRTTFFDVPLGDRLVVHGGVDYQNERSRARSPITLRVWISDRLAGELVHRDGDGWSSLGIDTSKLGFDRANVRFETTAEDPTARIFCWAASTRITQATDE